MADVSPNLDIADAHVVIESVDDNLGKKYLPGRRTGAPASSRNGGDVSLDLTFDTSSNYLSCRLHIPFATKCRPKEVVPISLYIRPERVTALETERPGDLPEGVSRQLGKEVIRLQFSMKSPADLVVPRDELVPRNRAYENNLAAMTSLARQTTITLYVASLTEEQLRPLCNAVSHGVVRSDETDLDFNGLYLGRGGRILTEADTPMSTKALLPISKNPCDNKYS